MAIKIRIVSDFDKRGMTDAERGLENLSKTAGLALAAVGAAMVGIGVKSVQEFAKFDSALVKSTAIMGDLTETMEKDMANAAREVAKVTTFSAEQAAESFFFLASAGLDAESSIKALPQVAQFAQAGMFDMARATDLLTDAQSALGLTIRDDAVANMENMIKVSDVLVRANTLANASVEQFSVALTTKAGAALRALGKDVEEGVAVLSAFADQGIKGESAGTQLSIVLRDLTTKAIQNKSAFDKMNIGVFDSTGNMNNLGNIIGDLENALAGMSDETQKATLLQLGFSDKSLASLQALLGTSEAIKTYETELRSASGFTENVANKQLESFEAQVQLLQSAFLDIGIEIGSALTPALMDLVKVVKDLAPEIGAKLSDAVRKVDWKTIATNVANFTIAIVENIDGIVKTAEVIGIIAISLVTYTTVTTLATTATALFTGALRLNPFGLAAAALVGLTIAVTNYTGSVDTTILSGEKLKDRISDLKREQEQLNTAFKNGVIDQQTYEAQMRALDFEINRVSISVEHTAGELNRFNQLRLTGAINSMNAFKNATSLAERQAKTFADSYARLEAIGAVTPRNPSSSASDAFVDAVASAGPSAFEQARTKVQDLIRSSQKQLSDAQKTLVRSQASARENYADSIIRIEQEFSSRLSSIIEQSQERLRSAYRSAVETNIAALFDQQESKSVEGLVASLSQRLAASRQLLSNAAQLASQGFSQTFIEQIVGAGTETGNELASAILQSTPETRKELQSLFRAIEVEASSGMNSLSNQIFQDQGLATDELKRLYESTHREFINAVFAQQNTLDVALANANNAFIESVNTIRSTLNAQIADMGENLGGLGGTVDQFIGKLDALIAKYKELANAAKETPEAPAFTIQDTSQMPTGGISFMPIDPGVSTGAMPAPVVNQFPQMPLRQVGLGSPTIINITAKADSSQSLAMVGKSLGNTVAKYVTGGGQVIVSNV